MNDPRRPERFGPPLPGSAPTGPLGPRNPPPVDPAYAEQAPYAPTYGGGYNPQWTQSFNETNPTNQLPAYWQQDLPPTGELPPEGLAPPPPDGPKSPRWLLIAAGAAVLVVVALVIALVLANGAIKTQTAVPPLPAMPGSSPETTTPTMRTPPRSRAAVPPPITPATPTQPPGPP